MYHLIAFDMDGTLLNSHKEISPTTQEAIREASLAGKEVVLSTGRALSELADYLPDLPCVHYGILASGAVLCDFQNQTVLQKTPIPIDLALNLATYARQGQVMVLAMKDGQGYLQRSHLETIERFHVSHYRQLYEKTAVLVDNIYDFVEEHAGDLEKINLYHQTANARDAGYEVLLSDRLAVVKAEQSGLEFTAAGVHKGAGLDQLCDLLGLSIAATIAVGDADNDREILVQAGLGLAMGNASDDIKTLADHILPTNDQDGCVRAITDYLLQ
ncbi:Cof-type HAD-IIB family hydrolase [Streptococcus caprae]|uniref:Cof-type HAD-IIB family hydrolase n=1 Tax=Streptococcus caprae TaxID=1640501 RepID=A0ABV8CUB0_9STRE